MVEDPVDDVPLPRVDEADDLHASAAAGALKGIDLPDARDEGRPAADLTFENPGLPCDAASTIRSRLHSLNYTLLSELDAHLPVMRCDRDCDLCCGFVSCTATEFDDVMALARANRIEPRRQGMTCPFYLEGRCSVYTVRPFTCRLFGHVDEASLTCPRGYNTNIAAEEVRRLREGYERERSMAGVRNLHEAVLTELQIAELLMAAVNPAVVGGGPVAPGHDG